MAFGYAHYSWSILLYLLLLLILYSNGIESTEMIKEPGKADDSLHQHREMNVLRLHSMDDDDDADIMMPTDHVHAHAHPSSHLDPQLMVFFLVEDLRVGNTLPIFFPKRNLSSAKLLPKELADSIPFSLDELPNLLQTFSFSRGSPQAMAMEATLRACETKPIKGETKICATSFGSMLDFVREIFGLEVQFKALSTTHLTKSATTLLQTYTILEVSQETSHYKMVACHIMAYPYAVFYCHYQESTESKVFRVLVEGENGDRAEAVAVCHMDTSQWSPNHVSFKVLGIEPGSSAICHFFPADNLVWISIPT
ncbi:BURP domain-containing protein BNM2A-like isoform X4 [Diospyros lotus]|uniref:BURP domain-containing protein BNM2A-like isoform X4 n=1 Tax=Diospyros lotus TaxID=55363 RepID=UPI002253E22F|nr:BURP domain-containing protein BNM2A-like isoform X4 [Diospyros lotus]